VSGPQDLPVDDPVTSEDIPAEEKLHAVPDEPSETGADEPVADAPVEDEHADQPDDATLSSEALPREDAAPEPAEAEGAVPAADKAPADADYEDPTGEDWTSERFAPLSYAEETQAAQPEPTPETAPEPQPSGYEAAALATEPPVSGFTPREPSMDTPRMFPLAAVVRVLVLPRSTFERVAEESLTVWPAALGVLALAGLTTAGVGIGLAFRGTPPFAPLAAVGLRYGWVLLAPFAFVLAFSGAMLLLQRLWRGEARFTRILNAAALALTPLALRDFGQALFMAIRQRVLVHPGLSAIVSPPAADPVSRTTYALLGQIDAFALWAFVLLVIASAVCRRRGWVRPAVAAICVCVALVLIGALPSFAVAVLLGGR
jgi:hypothetical protein